MKKFKFILCLCLLVCSCTKVDSNENVQFEQSQQFFNSHVHPTDSGVYDDKYIDDDSHGEDMLYEPPNE